MSTKAITLDMSTAQPIEQPGQSQQPSALGSYTVTTPKDWGSGDEESFTDTVQRAIANQRAMSPAERTRQLSASASTSGQKVPQVLAGAAAMGISGPAGLAAVGEGGAALAPLAGPAARILGPIAKKYGIKALEGAGLGAGYELYKELKKVFE